MPWVRSTYPGYQTAESTPPNLPFACGEREGFETKPLPTRPALRRSLRAFIRPHASGVQAAFFTPFVCGERRGFETQKGRRKAPFLFATQRVDQAATTRTISRHLLE